MSFHLFLLLFSLLPSVPCEAGANNASSPFSPARVLESDPDLSDCSTLRPGEEFHCPSGARCDELDLECLTCRCPLRCGYGRTTEAICKVREGIPCHGERTLRKPFLCHYCFQGSKDDYTCDDNFDCDSVAPPGEKLYIKTNCTTNAEVLCLGRRQFLMQRECNWTSGYKWTTALALSITLGGFGADRFYLGHWQEGIGKLFSFGGLGVWTLVDVIMVAIRYVGPSDGSLFI